MSSIIVSIIAFVILAVLFGIVFCAVIYPLWVLIHCAISKVMGTTAKVIWIIIMVLFWPLGGYVYGLFGSQKKNFQWISGSIFAFGLIFIIMTSYAMSWLVDSTSQTISTGISTIKQLDNNSITQEQLIRLNNSLLILDEEIHGDWLSFDKKLKAISLMDYFDLITEDKKITVSEYIDWMGKFESRQMLNLDGLQQYIKNLSKRNW